MLLPLVAELFPLGLEFPARTAARNGLIARLTPSYCAGELDPAPIFPEILVQPTFTSAFPIPGSFPPYHTYCRIPSVAFSDKQGSSC